MASFEYKRGWGVLRIQFEAVVAERFAKTISRFFVVISCIVAIFRKHKIKICGLNL